VVAPFIFMKRALVLTVRRPGHSRHRNNITDDYDGFQIFVWFRAMAIIRSDWNERRVFLK
jgi:hypothetical protein